MLKKRFIFPVLAILSLTLVGCGNTEGSSEIESEEPVTSEETSEDTTTTYTVTFNSNGGSPVRAQEVNEGETATRPTDPTKGGHTFVNWYTENTHENVYDFSTPVVANITLYAKWALSTSKTLVSELQYYQTNIDDQLAMFNTPGEKLHNINGWVGEGLTWNMSWRTIVIIDAEGRLAFGVHCPANGYGSPAEYSYASHEYYGPNGVGYEGNPAIVLGDTFKTNAADYEIVIPQGGFALIGHTLGANAIYTAVTGSTDVISSDSADANIAEERGRAFNKTHGEWSTRSFELDAANSKVKVYDLATHVTFTGDYSGAFTGDAATGTYTRTIKLNQGRKIAFSHFNGLLAIPVVASNYTFAGDYGEEAAISVDPDDNNRLIVNKTGNYTFVLDVNTNTFTISREAITEFKINLVDVVGTTPAYITVSKGEEFTLPTPTNIPAGYTFNNWIKADKTVYSNGVFEGENDITLYACYTKDGKQVAYSGNMGGFAVNSDAGGDAAAYWSEGNVLNDRGAWVGNGWRLYAVIDAEGRMAYGVMFPPNGYGGPDGGSYMCNDYYKGNHENNPAIEILEGYGPWNPKDPGSTAHNQFKITVPTGGFAITAHGTAMVKLLSLITNNSFPDFDGTDPTIHQYIAEINSSSLDVNNTFSYDAEANVMYSSMF